MSRAERGGCDAGCGADGAHGGARRAWDPGGVGRSLHALKQAAAEAGALMWLLAGDRLLQRVFSD